MPANPEPTEQEIQEALIAIESEGSPSGWMHDILARALRAERLWNQECAAKAEKALDIAEALKARIAQKDSIIETLAAVVYEVEGGNRWPVDWSRDRHIQSAIARARNVVAIPSWEKNPPGWKREAL